jgi:ATP-dependent Lhr-like helicase
MSLRDFHPAVARWFARAFPAPTAPQAEAWPAIRAGRHTLIAAPTGSGKTLAAFLAAIDGLVRDAVAGALADETRVLYVSPLKALSNDIERNLQWPLAGIREELKRAGLPDADIRVLVRTGDTPPGARAAMKKNPPHILVTTPESLYLLLTSESGRAMLSSVRSVIVDEIHAVAGSKRGAHLALSLERLTALVTPHPLIRIGLSATQKPIDLIARFLVGSDARDACGRAACAIIDSGHGRDRDLALELPGAPLETVMSAEVWEQIYDRLAELIHAHRTTLVFVNTRRLAERVTRHLSERLGKEHVTAHHGSLAKDSRFDAEQRLKHGKLRALVATASLELGIDIGDVDLVCQLASPRSIATFLQRVGRANHAVGGIPKGRLFPLSRDELIECAALLDAVRRGELDRLIMPQQPLDVLSQQIVAEVAAREYAEDELYVLVRRAYPYRALARADFDACVRMLADGFATRRGRRAAYLHRDAVNRRLRARAGARLTALTCGGAIPDNADYRVLLEPGGTFIGTLNEDFAVESQVSDIFQLGNASYRIRRIEPGVVRVEDARGAPPSIPFWLGEAPARTDELSAAVSRLRAAIDARLEHITSDTLAAAIEWLTREYRLEHSAARQIVEYLAAAKGMLGVLPTQETLVFERFFDETGGMQLVIHSPFGNRINRAWGLALRKRFCRQFNFELQAAAGEDAIVLSLGETHSFALADVARYLSSRSVREVLIQALLAAPLFTTRWRWAATIALAIKRFHGGRRNPPQRQRIQAEDLVAVVFPDQIACAENIVGDREVPDHPLVKQAIADCLTEAMDVDGLIALLAALESGAKRVVARDLPHPSPLAQEILNARPYGFLDDAPLEERRTQAVMRRRWLDPLEAAQFGSLDPEAIARVRAEAWPEVANADELHDALMLLGAVTGEEGNADGWKNHFERLVAERRAVRITTGVPSPLTGEGQDGGESHRPLSASHPHPNPPPSRGRETDPGHMTFWAAVERLPMLRAIYSGADESPRLTPPAEFMREWNAEAALTEFVRGQLQGLGPVTAASLAQRLGLSAARIDQALLTLEGEGFALRGRFTPASDAADADNPHPLSPLPSPSFPLPEGEGGEPRRASRALHNLEWCERRLLARIHRYTLSRLRAEIEPVSAADFMRFLLRWHGLASEPRPEGPQALAAIVEQLEGFEAAAVAWEADILPARLHNYDPDWLDSLCLAGRVLWARLTPPKPVAGKDRVSGPIRTTPIALLRRQHQGLWQSAAARRGEKTPRLSPRAQSACDYLREHGASFFEDIANGTGLLRSQAEEALAELVAAGLAHADGFSGLRALLVPAARRGGHPSLRRRRVAEFGIEQAGRWTLLRRPASAAQPDADTIEQVARLLLRRYGVVFKRVLEREAGWLPPWYELLSVYRRLEARGEIRGGRFVAGFTGEQYATPEAVSMLRALRREKETGALISVSAADPLNLVGILTPGARVPAAAGNRVLYRDGVPLAVQVAGESRFFAELPPELEWQARNALVRQPIPPALRVYLH